jgi:predicted phage-related endonuclease
VLTAEQLAMRLTGVGASELAAVVDLHPYRAAIDVWMSKPRPGGLPPLVLEADETEERERKAEVGDALEDGLRSLFTKRTGIAMARCPDTLRHAEHACILATPDGLSPAADDAGLELKVVGSRMAHHWEEDSVPDYVLTQAVGNMAVTGRARWFVAALVSGTDFRIVEIERDLELEEQTIEAAIAFWSAYVETGEPPPMKSSEERRRYLRARYPGSALTSCIDVTDREDIAEAARWLFEAKRQRKLLEDAEDELTAMLLAEAGAEYGIESEVWGKFIAPRLPGRIDWKAIAHELDGSVPLDLIEKHRGDGYRSPRLLPLSKKAKKARS